MSHVIRRPSQQITNLDVLQGLVLVGLLIAQTYGDTYPQPSLSLPMEHHPAELPVQFLMQLLVSGQFERMGSFLVGLGLYRCGQQAHLEGLAADRIARRFLSLLLGIGLVLSILHSSVDLLVCYALLGFTLLYVRNQSVWSLLAWMVGLGGLAILIPSGLGLLYPDGMTSPTGIDLAFPSLITNFRPGSHGKGVGRMPVTEWLVNSHSVSQGLSAFLSYELMMLGGLLVGKLGLSQRDYKLRVRLLLLQIGLLPAAIFFKGVWVALSLGLVREPQTLVSYQPMLLLITGFLGPLLLSGGYLLEVGTNARSTPSRWTRWLGKVGQMSLTNYVLLSILCPLLLYGYGLAVSGGQPTSLGRAGIVVGLYGVQIGFSYLWGKRYELGPLEWLCRHWLYPKSGLLHSVTVAKH